ncbi:MAG: hypothetical protein HY928_05950 [Elusimicrobia bacterium]|nr:hypothetical protein [Elusimicrobiota bacterium]
MTPRPLCLFALSAALAAPAAAAMRRAPVIHADMPEAQDRDWTRDPANKHLQALTLHLGDLITDKNPSKDDVPGVDHFVDLLQEELKKGSDAPRWRVLRNAKDARDQLRDAYDELRRAVEPLLEARALLGDAGEILIPAVDGEGEDAPKTKEAADSVKRTAEGIEADSPKAQGPDADASAVEPIKPREKDLAPVGELLKQVGQKVKLAKPWAVKAKGRTKTVDQFAQRARDIDKEIADSLGQRRTAGLPRDIDPTFNAEKVIRNANKWLKEAAKRADAVIKVLEKQTVPDAGLGLVNAKAAAADGTIMFGKAAGLRSAAKANAEAAKVREKYRPEWEAADRLPDDDPEKEKLKREAVEKATASKAAADDAAQKASDAADKAEEAAKQAADALSKAAEELKKLDELLGPDGFGDLPDLPELLLDAPEPKDIGKKGGAVGPKVNSKPLRYPKVLDDDASRIMLEYGEGR